MTTPANRPGPDQPHPLLADRPRLTKILANMHITIQQTLYRQRLDEDEERLVHGGVSSRDVLQQSLLELLRVDEASVTTSWEALSQTIARRRAIDTVRNATKGRRAPDAADDDPDEIALVAFDATIDEHTSTAASEIAEPEHAFVVNEQLRVLQWAVRELPDPQHRTIFNELFFAGRTRVEVGAQVGLTPQRVGQIYGQTLRRVWEQAQEAPEFPAETVWKEDT